MNEPLRLVDDMQAILSSDREPAVAEVTRLNTAYIAATEKANDRLRACESLLRTGHRSEAIHKCEAEPNLLEMVDFLDFPGREAWIHYMDRLDMPVPAELLISVAAELNEAYAVEKPLIDVMRRHRLLALSHGPLRERINLMRQIADLDSENHIWEDDVRTFERVRHDELSAAVKSAYKSADTAALAEIEQEITSDDWLEPPPESLVKKTFAYHTEVRAKSARQQLKRIEQQLTEAYTNFDVDEAKRLRAEWNAKAAIGISTDADPLIEQVAPAFQWLAEQEQQEQEQAAYESAISALEYALDTEEPRGELERLYHVLVRFDRGVTETLERRLRERVLALETAAALRGRLIIVSIVVFGLLIGGATAFGIYRHVRSNQIARAAKALEGLIEGGNLPAAKDYLEKLKNEDEGVHSDPSIQRLRGELDKAIEDDNARRTRLTGLMDRARKSGVDEGSSLATIARALSALAEAEPLCKSEEEKGNWQNLRQRIDEHQRELQSAEDERFLTALRELQGSKDKLRPDDLQGIENLINRIESLLRNSRASSEYQEMSRTLLSALKGMETNERRRQLEARLLAAITDRVGDRSGFVAALNRFTTDFPTGERAADYKRIQALGPSLWEVVDRWNACIGNWSGRDLRKVGPEDAKAMLDEATTLMATSAGFPAAQRLGELVPYLEAVVRRDGLDTSGLEKVLDYPVVKDLLMIETNDGKRYYLEQVPRFISSSDIWSFEYITRYDPRETNRRSLPGSMISNPKVDGQYDWSSPQSAFSTFARTKLGDLKKTPEDWEPILYQIISRLQEDTRLEPILKLTLLYHVLEVACQGGECLQEAFGNDLSVLQPAAANYVDTWLDQGNKEGQDANKEAAEVLQKLEDADVARQSMNTQLDRLAHPNLGARYVWIGWLTRDGGGWSCNIGRASEFASGAPIDGDLAVVLPATEGKPAKMVMIGKLQRNQATVSAVPEGVAEGQPVFLVAANAANS